MKHYIYAFAFILSIFYSCEDPIDIDVPTGKTRLVIEASLNWEKDTSGNEQTIKLSQSTPYFDTNTPTAVTGATVMVTNKDSGDIFTFADQNNGEYSTANFVPLLNNTYQLTVVYNGETYQATETLMPGVRIKAVSQSTGGGFDSENIEVNVFFDDPENQENYYLVRFYEPGDLFPYFYNISDEFSNGNEMNITFEKGEEEDNENAVFNPGDTVNIALYGISEAYYNYMRILIEQYYSGGDPFSSTAAQIRGNCINTNNPDNYAYGYFRVVEVDKTSYTFQ